MSTAMMECGHNAVHKRRDTDFAEDYCAICTDEFMQTLQQASAPRPPTAKDEILLAAKTTGGWQVVSGGDGKEIDDGLWFIWNRRAVFVQFDAFKRVSYARTLYPADFYQGLRTDILTNDRHAQVLAFIRGEH